jgi:hypothetical protein
MLDFRPNSTPYYRQRIDYGRLIMMLLSSALLLSLVLTFGRPRHGTDTTDGGGPGPNAAEAANDSDVTLVGVAVLVGSLCVVACTMLVLYRLTRPGRVRFAVHDASGPPPDFSSLQSQAADPATHEQQTSDLLEKQVQPEPMPEPHDAVPVATGESQAGN